MGNRLEKKYIPLATYFAESSRNEVTLTYTSIENIIGQQLPNAAYLNNSWWRKTKSPASHFLAWTESDFTIKQLELGQSVTFMKNTDQYELDQTSSNNTEYILVIRPIDLDDARAFINLQQSIDAESSYMLFGKDERKLSVQSIRKQIGEWKKLNTSQVFIGLVNGQYAGFLTLNSGPAPRASHRASLRIGVRKAYYGKNVGMSLMKEAESFAQKVGISRLELKVVEQNEHAFSLCKNMGYSVEGTRQNALFINSEYFDELYMGKNISPKFK
ncbi:GNAT family N-acetyltransferase [Paenisporosarcina sp. TG20]|uniref:GNAT family N-acetyltransferase n=1 Tax=Paenisporosarcina sp. TG20 TaxID=1211706 RepID=UPI0002DB4C05|nr:GNAT family N-acetyltransferase [Paenisporosarcina sp. TG20]